MLTRNLQEPIEKQFFKGKAILIIGACQTGKTTLVDTILQNRDETILRFNGDEADTNDFLGKATVTKLKRLIKEYSILFFDEAQKIENIGTILKLIVDNIKEVQVIASGSSMARSSPDHCACSRQNPSDLTAASLGLRYRCANR